MRSRDKQIRAKLADDRGASIVIALVFFLICAIIGSVVLTSASVNAKAVQTHREAQEAEFVVGSAAQAIGHELESAVITNVQEGENGPKPTINNPIGTPVHSFWDEYAVRILTARFKGTALNPLPVTVDAPAPAGKFTGFSQVFGTFEIDHDLNITVKITLEPDAALAAASPYNMTVYVQCIPTYNVSGKLTAFSYEPAVIKKGW